MFVLNYLSFIFLSLSKVLSTQIRRLKHKKMKTRHVKFIQVAGKVYFMFNLGKQTKILPVYSIFHIQDSHLITKINK